MHCLQLTYLSNGQLLITDEGLITATRVDPENVDKDNLFFTTNTSGPDVADKQM